MTVESLETYVLRLTCSPRVAAVALPTLSGTGKVVDVISSYINRNTDATQTYFCRLDATEEFPFLVTKLSWCHDRYQPTRRRFEMNSMKIPGFMAGASLWRTNERYTQAARESGSLDPVSPQRLCHHCPQGLLEKASGSCEDPRAGGLWCNILEHCFDC
jgi:hypothetical protein